MARVSKPNTAIPNVLEGFASIPLDQLRESPTNPRKRFDEDVLQELAASIREVGVLEPALARPVPGGFEVVAGSRRFRASKLAGLAALPCMVRKLDDRQALELQLVENNQRSDITPLEEGDAFLVLVRDHGRTIEEVADRVGRKPRYVEQRIKAAQATPAVRALLDEDLIGIGSAQLLVAFAPADQERIADDLRHQACDGKLSVNDVLHELAAWNRQIARAPFDVSAELGGVGPCSSCPKTSAAQLSLIGETERDAKCLDETCWDRKRDAGWELAKTAAEERGVEVVETTKYSHEFARLDERAWEIPSVRNKQVTPRPMDDDELDDLGEDDEEEEQVSSDDTWRALAEASEAKTVLVRTKSGDVFEALAPGEKERILKEHGVRSRGSSAPTRDPKDVALEARLKTAVRAQAMGKVVECFEDDTLDEGLVWPLLARAVINRNDPCQRICKRRGLEPKKPKHGNPDYVKEVRALISTLSWTEVRALVLEHELDTPSQRHGYSSDGDKVWDEALDFAGFDEKAELKTQLKDARAAAKAKTKAKAGKPAKKASKKAAA